jgi:hypothetical protein
LIVEQKDLLAWTSRLRQRLEFSLHSRIGPGYISRLALEHNGTIKTGRYIIEVGKPLHDGGETVKAILKTGNDWYLVCTRNRGAINDAPLYVDGEDVVEVG